MAEMNNAPKFELDQQAIQDVLTVSRRQDQRGVINAYEGNISVRSGDYVYCTPTSTNKAFLSEEMIAVLDLDGNQVAGTKPPSSEVKLHLHIYRNMPHIKGVVHAHAPYLTAHAICNKPVNTKSYPEFVVVYGEVEVASYGRPSTERVYKDVVPLLQKSNVVNLQNHGPVAVGTDVYQAMNFMEAAESCARILTIAKTVGDPYILPEEELDVLMQWHMQRMEAQLH